MDVSIGLPSTIPGAAPKAIIDFARRAEARGFSSLAVIDRIVYPNYEPLMTLSAAAAVTERIRLMTSILIVPCRPNTALLAKEIATLHKFSGGRFVLGVGLGGRDEDYTASGLSTKNRPQKLAEQIAEMRRIWSGEKRGQAGGIGPELGSLAPPQIIMGGFVDQAFKRAARLADGMIMAGGTPNEFRKNADRVRQEWLAAGRSGKPRLLVMAYFALGPDASEQAAWCIRDYYAFAGSIAEYVLQGVAVTEEAARNCFAGFEAAQCDELVLFPCIANVEQVDRLADAIGLTKRR